MDRDAFLSRLGKINVWKRRGQRAPHKPLLLLLALARLQRGEGRLARYEGDIRDQLKDLLRGFGPWRKSGYRPEFPFWHLQSDEIWEIPDEELRRIRGGKQSPSDRLLRDTGARGGFPDPVFHLLKRDPQLVQEAAGKLLSGHFPKSLHEAILDAVGFASETDRLVVPGATKRPRDPNFRPRVLTAYERRCAICDFDIRGDDDLVGLDAAHIKWHAADGPDEVRNGLALCTFHHVTFDRGAIGLKPAADGYRVLVSDVAHGQSAPFRDLLRHHDRPIRTPQRREQRPCAAFVAWHRQEVFRGEPRESGSA